MKWLDCSQYYEVLTLTEEVQSEKALGLLNKIVL